MDLLEHDRTPPSENPRRVSQRDVIPLHPTVGGALGELISFQHGRVTHGVLVCGCSPTSPERILLNSSMAPRVALLRAGDELVVGDRRFSLRESGSAEPVRFVSSEGERRCGRCKCALVDGDVVAHCSCGLTFHQGVVAAGGEPRLCFSYAPCSCGRAHEELDGGEEEDPDA
jgi:hypothetical protein